MLALSAILAGALYHAAACTIFTAAGNGMLLAGNNEDHDDPNGEGRFAPASRGKYGTSFSPLARLRRTA